MDGSAQLPVILIVDDDPDILVLLNHLMRHLTFTHEIVAVLDAQSALRHLAQRTVALVITDYMMPDMDGLQLIAAVRAASPTTRVILISADDSAAMRQRALSQQVDVFLSKAETVVRLEDVVRSVLRLASPKE
jgi:two-component system chemotaxis response regulator CheY